MTGFPLWPVRLGLQHVQPPVLIPLNIASVCAGFPSPADDHSEEALDPARLIVTNPVSTFMWRVQGRSMEGSGIRDGDYVVVDRSLDPRSGDVVVAIIDGLPSVKRVVRLLRGKLGLAFDSPDLPPLKLDDTAEAQVWGVVTWSLARHRDLR